MNLSVGEVGVSVPDLHRRIRELEKEVRRLRRQLREKERELRAREEELQSQFYLVSHELKTPLISIRGFANLLQEFHWEALDDEGREYLRRMIENVDQMEKLINNLLLLSRLRVEEEDLEAAPAKELIEEALLEQGYQIRETKATVRIAEDLPSVLCNRNLMVTVFSNLISNALKYSKASMAPQIDIGYDSDEVFHKFWVRDNGVGIAPKDRDRLFQLFSRLGNKRGVTGSGLGLAIVKRIVEAHGGEIWVKSRRGVGSCFYFTLPKHAGTGISNPLAKETG